MDLKQATDQLVDSVKETQAYQNYQIQKENIFRQPGLAEQINEYRKSRFQLQEMEDAEDLLELMEEFEKKYSDFSEDPMINDFLDAEVSFCRMVQEIYENLTNALNFE